jgi:hypothetical protein
METSTAAQIIHPFLTRPNLFLQSTNATKNRRSRQNYRDDENEKDFEYEYIF